MNPITSLSPTSLLPPSSSALNAAAPPQPFKNVLLDAIKHVNQTQHAADQAVQQLATGADVNPAAVLTSLQKADMSFHLMLQVRNQLVQAFQEVNNIRI
jgi:flagellar hook-basal body complex protein FliE